MRLPLFVFVLAAAGCGSKGTSGAAALDAGMDDAATTDADAVPTCGDPPYVTVQITVVGASMDPTPPRVEGALFTSPLCPAVSLTSAHDGTLGGRISKGIPLYGRFEAKGYAKTLIPEELFTADAPDLAVTLPPALLGALIPGFSATSTAIFVNVFKDGGHGACASVDGVSFDVVDHPEATVTYFSTDPIPSPTGGTSTTTSGRAAITGLAAGPLVSVRAQKPGCTVTLAKGTATGRSPLENGAISIAGAYLRD